MAAIRLALAASLIAAPAAIAAPKVVADIPAVHSIASAVMQGVGTPALIVRPGASPHGYSMKPSEAQAVADADVIFWIGHEFTPWLETAVENLGEGAVAVEMMDAPGLRLLGFRDGATFEEHDHGEHEGHGDDDHDDHDEHAHKDDDEHSHDDHDKHDHEKDHAKAEDDHGDHDGDKHAEDEHGHGAHESDPHIWLDPANGRAMADMIAATLAAADPANAAAYAANAAAFKAEIDAVEAELRDAIAPIGGRPFIVFHDAYHYFEARFDVEAAGALSVSDATPPGPARVEEIRALIQEVGTTCVFTEPQFDKRLVSRLIDGTGAKSGELDPQGADIEPGPGLYPALLRKLGDGLIGCLSS